MSESPGSGPVCVGWMKLFHPTGVLVSLPIDADTSGGFDYSKAFRCVQAAILAGFTVNAPGLEAGEQREDVGYVCRCEKENANKTITPHIHLYSPHDAVKYKILSVYLNDDAAVEAFEAASGLRLADLKVYDGTAAPKRNESTKTDKYIEKVPRPFPVVMRPNPKYDEKEAEAFAARKETYKVPKREFVRWEGQQAEEKPTQTVTPAQVSPDPSSPEANGADPTKTKNVEPGTLKIDHTLVGEWERFLKAEPTIEEMNRKVPYAKAIKTEATRRKIWEMCDKYSKNPDRCWEYDWKKNVFVPPKDAAEEDEGVRIGKATPF